MKVLVARDSVHPGDDVDAPHEANLEIPRWDRLAELASSVLARYSLPLIQGGAATWVLSSRTPVAVCAQQWKAPVILWGASEGRSLEYVDGRLRMHVCYMAQTDPEQVLEVLQRLRLRP